jgi:hypothetical protein
MTTPYPKELPVAEVLEVIEIVRSGQISERKEEFANDLWHIQGFAQGVIIGHPDAGSAFSAQGEIDVLVELEKIVEAHKSGAVVAHASIPWQKILEWILKLLEEIFSGETVKATTPYPDEFPVAEITEVIEIVRNGQIEERKKELANDLWHIQGYIQGILIGHPELAEAMSAQADFDAVAELEKLVEAHKNNVVLTQAAVPWLLLLKWAVKLLNEILN